MTKPTGIRVVTPGQMTAQSNAEMWGMQTAVAKNRALIAFNNAAPVLGINSNAQRIFGILISFTKADDWKGDTRPIAWPSNDLLVLKTGLSIAALKRGFNALADKGLLTFKDSPTGKRSGTRTADGRIDLSRTFGFDLSPLGVMTPALEQMAEQRELLRQEIIELSNRFTRDRKKAESIIAAGLDNKLTGPWQECEREILVLVDLAGPRRDRRDAARLTSLCDRIAAVLERARTAYAAAVDKFDAARECGKTGGHADCAEKETPAGLNCEPLIQNTDQKNPYGLYSSEERGRSASADQLSLLGAGDGGKIGFGKKPECVAAPVQQLDNANALMSLNDLRQHCRHTWEWMESPERPTWQMFVWVASSIIKPALKIPDTTWQTAARLLGREIAAIAVAIIYEKYAEGIIKNPGGYLNGMISKAQTGELHLAASLRHWRDAHGGNGGPVRH